MNQPLVFFIKSNDRKHILTLSRDVHGWKYMNGATWILNWIDQIDVFLSLRYIIIPAQNCVVKLNNYVYSMQMRYADYYDERKLMKPNFLAPKAKKIARNVCWISWMLR